MVRKLWCLGLLVLAWPAMAAPRLPQRLFVFTLQVGFNHTASEVAAQTLSELGQRTGLFETVVSRDVKDLTPGHLREFDAVFFYTTGNLSMTDEQNRALLDYIRGGGSFLGVHSATDTNHQRRDYIDMIGGEFDGHPWHQQVTIRVDDPQHAATEGLDDKWPITDEIYQQKNWSRDKCHVLLNLDPDSVNLTLPAVHRQDRDFAISWCKDYGQGRVFYSALGHRAEVWADPRFRRHLLGALKWAFRVDWRSSPELQKLAAAQDVAGLAQQVGALPEVLRSEPLAALGAVGTPAAAAQLAELAKPEQLTDVRLAALRALGQMTAGGMETFTAALGDSSTQIRAAAVRALGRRPGAEAEQRLLARREDPSPVVQAAVIEALGRVGTPGARDALLAMVQGPDRRQQRAALNALQAFEPAVEPVLVGLVTRPDEAHAELLPAVIERLAPRAAQEAEFVALRGVVGAAVSGDAKAAAIRALAGSGRVELVDLFGQWIFGPDATVARVATAESARVKGLNLAGRLTAFVPRWLIVGPFASPGGRGGHNKAFGPEQALDLGATYAGQGGQVRWREAAIGGDRLDFRKYLKPTENVLAYAHVVLRAAEDLRCELRLGSDDGAKVWLNGQQVLSKDVPRGLVIDDDRVAIELHKGDNPLLVKVMQGAGDWTLTVRLARPEGGLDQVQFVLPPAAP